MGSAPLTTEAFPPGEVVYVPLAKPLSLVRKLAAVMGVVERVAKNGTNKFHNYTYATEADITQAVRGEMSSQGVMMIPTVEKIEWQEVLTKAGAKEKICTAHFLFTLMDGDSDAKIEFRTIGQGQDGGDKAFYKSATGAVKYALLKLFLIPTGDDPEDEKAPKNIPAPAGVEKLKQQIAKPKVETPPHWENPPPHTDEDAERFAGMEEQPRQRTHEDFAMGPFGKCAGQLLSTLADNDVLFYRGACQKTLADATKSKFHSREILRLAGFNAELAFRGLPV